MMNDRHPSPDYPRDEKPPIDPAHQKGQIRPGSAQSGHGPPPSSMGPPPSYTTVTMTTDNTPGARVTEINLNIGYYKTLPGILKVVQMVIFKYQDLKTRYDFILLSYLGMIQFLNVFRYLESFVWHVHLQQLVTGMHLVTRWSD